MKEKKFKRIIGMVLIFSMLLTCVVFSPIAVSATTTKFKDITINFENNNTGDIDPNGIYGTVETVDGNNVLKITEGKTSYVNTGLTATDTGKYEIKYSIRPDTKKDAYMVGFDSDVAYYGTEKLYRLTYFDPAANNGQLQGWYSGSNAWSYGNGKNRLKAGYVTGAWYNVTAIFDLTNSVVDVRIDGTGISLDTNTYQITLPEGAYPTKLRIASIDKTSDATDAVCYVDNLSIKKLMPVEYDMADYTDATKPEWMAKGTIATIGERQALKLSYLENNNASVIETLPVSIDAADTGKYEIKFSIYPENNDGTKQYLVTFNGNVANGTYGTYYRVFGAKNANLFGYPTNGNPWALSWNNNRLSTTAPKSQWYDVTVIWDQALDCAVVNITTDGGAWEYFMTDLPEGSYLKEINFRCENANSVCYIDDISIKPYTGAYDYMASCDGIFKTDGTTEITAWTAGDNSGFSNQTKDTEVKAKINYINPAEDNKSLTCLIGYYDKDNRLVSANIIPTTSIPATTSGTYLAPFTVPEIGTITTVKIFMWDDMTGVTPVGSMMKPY